MKYLDVIVNTVWASAFFVAIGHGVSLFGIDAVAMVFSPVTLFILVSLNMILLVIQLAIEFYQRRKRENIISRTALEELD